MDKLNTEVTVIVTEKLTLKKEFNRVSALLRGLQKDQKELRDNYNDKCEENDMLVANMADQSA